MVAIKKPKVGTQRISKAKSYGTSPKVAKGANAASRSKMPVLKGREEESSGRRFTTSIKRKKHDG